MVNSTIDWFVKEATKIPMLTKEEEKEVITRLSNEATRQDALNTLVEHNLRLVINEVKKFYLNPNAEDLVSAGNMGLIEAAEKFDPSKGTAFSTYATYYIKQRVYSELVDNSLIRLPANVRADLKALAEYMSDNQYAEDEDICKALDWTQKRLANTRNCNFSMMSIDQSANEDEEDSMYDLIEDTTSRTPEQVVEDECDRHIQSNLIKSLLDILSEGERKVIMMQFGVGYDKMSVAQIAEFFDVKESRIETIAARALTKLKRKGATIAI